MALIELNLPHLKTDPSFISSVNFRDKFTFEERVKIDNSTNPKVITFIRDLSLRTRPVNLRSPRFALAMALLIKLELIDVGRDLVIMGNSTPSLSNVESPKLDETVLI